MAVTKFVLNETSYFGEGARSVLADEIKNRGFKKVLVVTDKSLYEVGAVSYTHLDVYKRQVLAIVLGILYMI